MSLPDATPEEPGPSERWPWWRRALLLALVPTLLLAHAFSSDRRLLPHLPTSLPPLSSEAGDAALEGDQPINYFTADRVFPTLTDQKAAKRMLAQGDLPLWEPTQGLGVPLFAGTIAGFAYPPNWIALALDPARIAVFLAFLTLLIAGLGMWLWLARLGLGELSCAVGAVALQGGGWGLVNLEYPMKVDAAVWLPFALWAAEGVLAGQRLRGFALAVFTTLALLAGFPPIALFGGALVAAYALARALSGRPGRARIPRVASVIVFLALGVAGGSVQVLPTVELSNLSIRQDATATSLESQSLPLCALRGIGLAHLFGAPSDAIAAGQDPMAWALADPGDWERTQNANSLEWNTYSGLAIALLALIGTLFSGRRAAFPAVLLCVCFAYAAGVPGARLLYHVPGLNLGDPARILAVAWVLWAWLAALGANALLSRATHPRLAPTALIIASLATAAYAWTSRSGIDLERFPAELESQLVQAYQLGVDEIRDVVAPDHMRLAGVRLRSAWTIALAVSLALILCGVLCLLARPRRFAFAVSAVLTAIIAAEAYVAGGPHLAAPHLADGQAVFPRSEAMEAVRRAAGDGRVLRIDPHPDVRDVLSLARPNMPHAYGIGDLTPYQVFSPTSLVELFEALDPGTRFRSGIARLPRPELLAHPILDRARVTAILSRTALSHPRLEEVFSAPNFHVYHRTGCRPIAEVLAGVEVREPEATLQLLSTRAVDASSAALILGENTATGTVAQAGQVETTRPAPDRLDVKVVGTSGGWLVMREQWFPGWTCSVDGVDAEIHRADHAFRAVHLGPGDHIVRTQYEPRSFRLGLLISSLALLAALVASRKSHSESAQGERVL